MVIEDMPQYIFVIMQSTPSKHQSPLHLVGHFDNPYAGAERELPDLAALLRGRRDVLMWSDVAPHPWFAALGVRQIRPFANEFPKGGMVLFAGVHVRAGVWLQHAQPDRIALRYNLPNHARLFEVIEQIVDATGMEPELLFVSKALRTAVGLPGTIEPSLINLEPFMAMPVQRPGPRPFTLGRVSRDVPEKHHSDDPALYRMLAAQGIHVRIMGGSCLAPALAGVNGVELLPVGALPAEEFFQSIDLMFYRTGSFYEAYGRVIFEAMASGLPVVAGISGGYAEWLKSGHDAVLIATQEQAVNTIVALQNDSALRLNIGMAARATAMSLHGPIVVAQFPGFYVGGRVSDV